MGENESFSGFDELSDEEVKRFHAAMGASTSINDSYEWWKQLGRYVETRKGKKSKGVFIITSCGDSHHVEPSQEVTEIYINGELAYEKS